MDQDHKTEGYWMEANLVPRFRDLMNNFLTSLRAGNMPSFFIPSYNLFQGKDLTEAIQKVEKLINTIITNPNSLLPHRGSTSNQQASFKISYSLRKRSPERKSMKKILRIQG